MTSELIQCHRQDVLPQKIAPAKKVKNLLEWRIRNRCRISINVKARSTSNRIMHAADWTPLVPKQHMLKAAASQNKAVSHD